MKFLVRNWHCLRFSYQEAALFTLQLDAGADWVSKPGRTSVTISDDLLLDNDLNINWTHTINPMTFSFLVASSSLFKFKNVTIFFKFHRCIHSFASPLPGHLALPKCSKGRSAPDLMQFKNASVSCIKQPWKAILIFTVVQHLNLWINSLLVIHPILGKLNSSVFLARRVLRNRQRGLWPKNFEDPWLRRWRALWHCR